MQLMLALGKGLTSNYFISYLLLESAWAGTSVESYKVSRRLYHHFTY